MSSLQQKNTLKVNLNDIQRLNKQFFTNNLKFNYYENKINSFI